MLTSPWMAIFVSAVDQYPTIPDAKKAFNAEAKRAGGTCTREYW
jgi:hypothetical protein